MGIVSSRSNAQVNLFKIHIPTYHLNYAKRDLKISLVSICWKNIFLSKILFVWKYYHQNRWDYCYLYVHLNVPRAFVVLLSYPHKGHPASKVKNPIEFNGHSAREL